MLYHITDYFLEEKILNEGLIGNPVVYIAISRLDCLSIRRSQELAGEKFGPSVIFGIDPIFELLIDPNVKPTPFGYVSFMVYADIPPELIRIVYGD